MAKCHLSLTAITIAWCGIAQAEAPRVATDIAPVHSLAAQVMGDLGTPSIILPPGASPHGYALRPSEARALSRAELVFWIGPELTPWMEDAIATLAQTADVTELLAAPTTKTLKFRDNALFEVDEHAPTESVDHDDHDHDNDAIDPHAWLDPQNAAAWLELIAEALSEADPENAAIYEANAASARADLETLSQHIHTSLDPIRGMQYVVFHDAYQYFETRFDVPAQGAISLGDATDPGAARVAKVRDLIRAQGITCVAAEPQFNPALVDSVAVDGTRTTVLDPLGTSLTQGNDYYSALIEGLAVGLLACK